MRYSAWVFHGDGYDIALEIDLLEAQYRRQRNLIFSSFKSLEKMDKDEVKRLRQLALEVDPDNYSVFLEVGFETDVEVKGK